MSSPTLTYFAVPGRAFAARAALRYAKVEYHDERITYPVFLNEWKKNPAKCPLGSLPVLVVPGVGVFTQSTAISTWAAKKSDLYPKEEDKQLACDELQISINELLSKVPQHPDQETKKKLRMEFMEKEMVTYCSLYIHKLESSGGPFLLGPM
jgi:glutathione S-transferase